MKQWFAVAILFFLSACWFALPSEAKADGDPVPARTDRYGDPLPPEAVARLGTIRFRHANSVSSVCFSPDGKRVLSGSCDNKLVLWDVESGKRLRTFEGHTEGVTSVSFSPDGKRVLSGSRGNTVALWDAARGKRIRTFEGHTEGVTSVCFIPDGKQVISGSNDSTLALWDVASGKRILTFKGHSRAVTSLCISPDGKRAISCSHDITIPLRDAKSMLSIRTFRGHSDVVTSVCFSPDCKRVLSGSRDKTLALWDVASGERIRTFKGHSAQVNSVDFSPDGKWAISGSDDKTLALWDVASGKRLRTFKGHSGGVKSVRFSPGGRRIISGSFDTTLLVWHPFLSEVKEAEAWAKEIQRLPEAERKAALQNAIRSLASNGYREYCRSRERILASGPECLDLLGSILTPGEPLEGKRLGVLLQRLDSDCYETRIQAQQNLTGYGTRILDWVAQQQEREDFSREVRSRLKAVEVSIRKRNSHAIGDVGRLRAVLLLIEVQDRERLKPYAMGYPEQCETHLARQACGYHRQGP